MKKILFLLTIALLSFVDINAQFKVPSEKDIIEINNRKTIYVEDFFSSDEQREWFKKYWKFDHKILFKSTSEIQSIVKQKRDDAIILSARKRNEMREGGSGKDYRKMTVSVYMITLYLSEKSKPWDRKNVNSGLNKEIFKISLNEKPSSEVDFKFIAQHFNNYLGPGNNNFSKPQINNLFLKRLNIDSETLRIGKEKILLIPQSICELTDDEIKSVYSFPYKVVDEEYIQQSILNENENESYIKIIFSDVGFMWSYFILSTENGEVLNKGQQGGVTFGVVVPTGLGEGSLKYKAKDFNLKSILKSFNYRYDKEK